MSLLAAELKKMLPKEYSSRLKNLKLRGGCEGYVSFEGMTVKVNTEPLGSVGEVPVVLVKDGDQYGPNYWAEVPELVSLITRLLTGGNPY